MSRNAVGLRARTVATAPDVERALRILRPLLLAAVAVSLVHYTDNAVNLADYPHPASGPDPPAGVIVGSWFVFTAFAVAGYLLLVRERVIAAAACLALYSGSGLIGIGHYAVAGATDMVWWRQAHVVADISCGVAMFVYACWLARSQRALAAKGGAR